MFERWESDPNFPTLKLMDRTVYVDMYQAIPGCVGGFMKQMNITVRSDGLRLESWMQGRQIAWVRTHANHWIGVVEVKAHSSNGLCAVLMTLWLPAQAFQIEPPSGYLVPRDRD